ncbi:MAG: phenylacetate--CoA ligase family protein [Chloroflexi bacterium]|nr:phenylacetate--CoA ligase family protein [Chloroflexota bacterium]
MTKARARGLGPELLNAMEAAKAMELRSSGSTGEPFVIQVSKNHWVMEQAIVWRHWSWMGYRFRDRMAIVRSYVPEAGEPLWKLDPIRNFLYMSAYHLTPENAAAYLEKLREWQPKYLRGYPSSLYILAKMAEAQGITAPRVKGILTASESLLPVYRETIERVFGASVFDWYGQSEETITMNECEAHQGLHINLEYGYCELLADPSLPENERRIVATCLHNLAMPLIRYETGDVAVLAEDGALCGCGRTLPLVKAIKGRSDDFIRTPDGRIIPSVNFYTLFYELPNIIAFQLVQREVGCLEVYIKSQDFGEALLRELRTKLQDRLGEAINIQIHLNEAFVQTGEGKKRVVVSMLGGADAV